MHALQRVLLGRFLHRAAPADVDGAVGEDERDRVGTRREAVTLGRVRQPARRQVVLVLGKDGVRVPHAAVIRHGADAG